MYVKAEERAIIDRQFDRIFGGTKSFHVSVKSGGIGVCELQIPLSVAWCYRYDLRYTNTSGRAGDPVLELVLGGVIAEDAIPKTDEEWATLLECSVVVEKAYRVFANRWWRWQLDGLNIEHAVYDVAKVRAIYAALNRGEHIDVHARLSAARIK